MKTSILLCLFTAALVFHPSAQADTTFRPLPICPPDLPDMPRPVRPCHPLPPTADPWDQLAVTGTDDGCVRLPGKPTRPTPFTAAV